MTVNFKKQVCDSALYISQLKQRRKEMKSKKQKQKQKPTKTKQTKKEPKPTHLKLNRRCEFWSPSPGSRAGQWGPGRRACGQRAAGEGEPEGQGPQGPHLPASLLHSQWGSGALAGVPRPVLRSTSASPHPTREIEKSCLTRSILSHTSMSSITEGCATGIYGGGKQRAGQPHSQAREDRTPDKVNRQKQPPKETKMYTEQKNTLAQQAQATRGSHI